MSSIKLSKENNDLLFESGNLILIEKSEEVEQLVRTNLRTFFQEWFLDTRIGIPYIEEFFVKTPNIGRIDAILKNVILNTPGVEQLVSFELGFITETRSFTCDFQIKASGEIIKFNEVI